MVVVNIIQFGIKTFIQTYTKYTNKIIFVSIYRYSLKTRNMKNNKNKTICPELGLNQRPLAFQANALPLSYPNPTTNKLQKYQKITKITNKITQSNKNKMFPI